MNGLKGLRGYIGLSLVWVAVLGAALFFVRRPSSEPIEILPPPTVAPTVAPSATPTPGPLRVDVAGAVASPGIYTLPRGSLVADAVAAAGGAASDADLDRINKAMPLQDSMQVFVPRVAQPIPTVINPPAPTTSATAPVRSGQAAVPGKPVNLNTATLGRTGHPPRRRPGDCAADRRGAALRRRRGSDARQGDRPGDIRQAQGPRDGEIMPACRRVNRCEKLRPKSAWK